MIWRGVNILAVDPSVIHNGHAGVAQLAVRILSVVPNSAGCERIFSLFGNIHTKLRNRLHPLLVHRSGIARLYVQRDHTRNGLITSTRKKRKFGENPEPGTVNSDSQEMPVSPPINAVSPDAVDFTEIATAIATDIHLADQAVDEAGEPTDHISVPLHPEATSPQPLPPNRTSIPLSSLFIFPEDRAPVPLSQHSKDCAKFALEFYWKGGIKNLEDELASYDLLHLSH